MIQKDLFVNFIGALVFSVGGYFMDKYQLSVKFARQFRIIVFKNDDEKNAVKG